MKINILTRIKSYFSPQIIEKTKSSLNPVLLVVLENNRLLLHTEKVNYSFGTLHQAFHEVLFQISLPKQPQANCLILGLGAGSIAQILIKKLKQPIIIGVEADPKVIELGKKWFDLESLQIQIIEQFAEQFIQENTQKFDLILVDLFIDEKNASCCLDEIFWNNISNQLKINGKVIINKLSGRADLNLENETFEHLWEFIFPNFDKMYVNDNVLYIGSKIG